MSDSPLSAAVFWERLEPMATAEQLAKYERFFPLDQRGDDVFIGVAMGKVFALAKEFVDMELDQIERLLEHEVHEARVGAVSVMDFQARRKSTGEERRIELFELYLRRHDRINAWDLVDRSAIHVVGAHLRDRPRDVLYTLARSEDPWRRRTAIVATLAFSLKGDTADAFAIAEILRDDPVELVNKATGWALRTAGGEELLDFLDRHAAQLPRTTLRAAIEKLPAELKQHYRALR